jgi:hypothetical protein
MPYFKPNLAIAAHLAAIAVLGASSSAFSMPAESAPGVVIQVPLALGTLAAQLKIGDLVFIRVPARPFREVAGATDSWTNHVGIVVEVAGNEPIVGESAFPFSRFTPLSRFVARSEGGRVAVTRLQAALTAEQQTAMLAAARQRTGIFYDTGFDLHSRRQFCSRYVREVLLEATGQPLGEVETFAALLSRHPGADLSFWKLWYFGRIPWDRETVTPASVMRSAQTRYVFDGVATARD